MLAHPSDRKACKSKTTLIICPVGLMDQWKAEIKRWTDDRLRVLIFHGKTRPTGASTVSERSVARWLTDRTARAESRVLHKYDVVVTSYPTCQQAWNGPKKKQKGQDSDDGSEADNTSPLYDPDRPFYRSECFSVLNSLFRSMARSHPPR